MKISKIKASTSTRTMPGLGKTLPRQDRTSKAFQRAKRADGGTCGEVEGESVRPRIGSVPMRRNGGPLTTKARNALPGKDFALAGGRYPIEDENHARNALSRVSQFGTSEEKAKVRAKVSSKYPEIGRKHGGRVKRDSGGEVDGAPGEISDEAQEKYLRNKKVGKYIDAGLKGATAAVGTVGALLPYGKGNKAFRTFSGGAGAASAKTAYDDYNDAKQAGEEADKFKGRKRGGKVDKDEDDD